MTNLSIDNLTIGYGTHKPKSAEALPTEMCIMEAVWVQWALENNLDVVSGWTDRLECVCPSIATRLISFNDRCGTGADANERRKRVLGPLYNDRVILGTKATTKVERKREWMASDWGIRVATPKLLRLTSFSAWADKLDALPETKGEASLKAARAILDQVANAAYAARSEAWAKLRKQYATAADAAAAATATATADATADATYKPIFEASHKARLAGGGWSECYAAARKVADPIFAARTSPFRAMRDELDTEFVALIRRMAAVKT